MKFCVNLLLLSAMLLTIHTQVTFGQDDTTSSPNTPEEITTPAVTEAPSEDSTTTNQPSEDSSTTTNQSSEESTTTNQPSEGSTTTKQPGGTGDVVPAGSGSSSLIINVPLNMAVLLLGVTYYCKNFA